MPTVKILAILDEAAGMGFRGEVAFHYYSEPLLDERNAMLAGEAKQRGMQPYLHTNGDVLKLKPDLCDEIQGVYQRVAVGLYDFQTDDELEEAKSYWRRRLDRVDLSFSYIPLSRSGGARSIGVPRALAPSDARMAVPDFTYLNAPCHRPLLRMIIQYDGEMGNCCEDTHGAFGLGNIYRNTLKELWYSERHVKVVVDLVNGRRELFELCRICPMAPTGKSPLGDKINMEPRRLREVPVFRPGVA